MNYEAFIHCNFEVDNNYKIDAGKTYVSSSSASAFFFMASLKSDSRTQLFFNILTSATTVRMTSCTSSLGMN